MHALRDDRSRGPEAAAPWPWQAMRRRRPVTEPDDHELMRRYAGGDVSAFDVLYRRHRAPLYRFLLRQLNDEATANDLYQATWEKVIGARQTFRPDAPFGAWLFRIARNTLIDHWRRQKPETADALERLTDEGPGPEQQLRQAHRDADLADAISRLPPPQREAVLLRLEGGFSTAEIAKLTGVGFETAKSRLRYATQRLQTDMTE